MAREKVQVCLDQLIEAASLRVHADVFAFSDLVRAQIPTSWAAHAYNDLAGTLLEKVLLSTARFWDPPDDYEANVLTIIALISDDGVRQLLVEEAGDIYRHQRSTEPQILASFADQNERRTARSLARLDRLVPFVAHRRWSFGQNSNGKVSVSLLPSDTAWQHVTAWTDL